MKTLLLLLFRRQPENGAFDLIYFGTLLSALAAYTLWDRRYRRQWQQFRARDWQTIDGRFDEGEVVTMRKGRSGTLAGYEVWLGYEYEYEGKQGGFYRCKFTPSKDEAEGVLKLLANRAILIRVAPTKPYRSIVFDEDVAVLTNTSVSVPALDEQRP